MNMTESVKYQIRHLVQTAVVFVIAGRRLHNFAHCFISITVTPAQVITVTIWEQHRDQKMDAEVARHIIQKCVYVTKVLEERDWCFRLGRSFRSASGNRRSEIRCFERLHHGSF